jgi:hypothetical protein
MRRITERLFAEESFVYEWRRKRMKAMLDCLRLPPKARIVDLGGSESIWKLIDHDYHVTMVNLPGWNPPVSDPERFSAIDADACNLGDMFGDMAFDAVYSNSTIEHVGDESRQALFANEVRRLAPAYWVQTPSTKFPLEVHTAVPFFWSLPEKMRQKMIARWQKTLPAWTEMIKATRVLSRERMKSLFPDAEIYSERKYGFEKSYAFYRPHPAAVDAASSPKGGAMTSQVESAT